MAENKYISSKEAMEAERSRRLEEIAAEQKASEEEHQRRRQSARTAFELEQRERVAEEEKARQEEEQKHVQHREEARKEFELEQRRRTGEYANQLMEQERARRIQEEQEQKYKEDLETYNRRLSLRQAAEAERDRQVLEMNDRLAQIKAEIAAYESQQKKGKEERLKMSKEEKCIVCGNTKGLQRCAGCKAVYYCRKECQKQDWPAHKLLCKELKKGEKLMDAKNRLRSEEEQRQQIEIGRSACGNHMKGDLSLYVHALNNMAGSHRIDYPLDNETTGTSSDLNKLLRKYSFLASETVSINDKGEEYTAILEEWENVESDEPQRSGIHILAGSRKKRAISPLGMGLKVKGKIRIGSFQRDNLKVKDYIVELDSQSNENKFFDFEEFKELVVSDHLILLKGSFIDPFCILHGPLIYYNHNISEKGGVHIDGCAFADGVALSKEVPVNPYFEICIEAIMNGYKYDDRD